MYVFFAVAPCNFNLNGKSINLRAGDTLTVDKPEADRIRSIGFPYARHLRLIQAPPEQKKEEPKKVEVKPVEKTVEPPQAQPEPQAVVTLEPTSADSITVTEAVIEPLVTESKPSYRRTRKDKPSETED